MAVRRCGWVWWRSSVRQLRWVNFGIIEVVRLGGWLDGGDMGL